jgi:hypothetical protein
MDRCIGRQALGANPEQTLQQLSMRQGALVECDVEGAQAQMRSHRE